MECIIGQGNATEKPAAAGRRGGRIAQDEAAFQGRVLALMPERSSLETAENPNRQTQGSVRHSPMRRNLPPRTRSLSDIGHLPGRR